MQIQFDSVKEFATWWYKAGSPIRPPFDAPVFTTDIAYSLCLYREGNCQVELYICKPNTESPTHYHPGVDSLFVYLGGNLEFGKEDGSFLDLSTMQRPDPTNKHHMLMGKNLDSLESAPHSLRVFKEGGAFLSFEKWDKQAPTSVTVNWVGETVGNQHVQTMQDSKEK